MDIESARNNAIKQQLRPWGGLNYIANNALKSVPRECFTPEKYKNFAFADMAIPLRYGAYMLAPKIEGKILDALNISPEENVLEIGTGSGYLSAVMSKLSQSVTTVEINENLHKLAKDNIAALGINNITLLLGDASQGWVSKYFFDVVLVSASMPKIINRYFHLLRIGGRIFVVEGVGEVMSAKLITRLSEIDWQTQTLFETHLNTMQGLQISEQFKF